MKKIIIIVGFLGLLLIAGCGVEYRDCKALASMTTEATESECIGAMAHECIPAKGITDELAIAYEMEMVVNKDCSVEFTVLSPKRGLEQFKGASMTCFWDNVTKNMTSCEGEIWDLLEDEIEIIDEMKED